MSDPIEFRAWPKTPRLMRQAWITEKIDGTNGCVVIREHAFGGHVDGVPTGTRLVLGPDSDDDLPDHEYLVAAQSRKRLITPDDDNHGFARWVHANADELVNVLGPGYHYGEWWGRGIQRGYGMDYKKFSLFNTRRWWFNFPEHDPVGGELDVVPVLDVGDWSTEAINEALDRLRREGSAASPGYMRPEGICIYHEQAEKVFKVLLDRDDLSKSELTLRS